MKAIRVVLSDGLTIMEYFKDGAFGFAFAGRYNILVETECICSKEFLSNNALDWANKLKENEDVEIIEII